MLDAGCYAHGEKVRGTHTLGIEALWMIMCPRGRLPAAHVAASFQAFVAPATARNCERIHMGAEEIRADDQELIAEMNTSLADLYALLTVNVV